MTMPRIESSIRRLHGCGPGVSIRAEIDWWHQTEKLSIVELNADFAALRGGRRVLIRMGFDRGSPTRKELRNDV